MDQTLDKELAKVGVQYSIRKEVWENPPAGLFGALDGRARRSLGEFGEIVGDLTRRVAEEQEIDGHRLWGEWEGVELPPMVLVRYTAHVIPREDS